MGTQKAEKRRSVLKRKREGSCKQNYRETEENA